jgi:hypothetical protein
VAKEGLRKVEELFSLFAVHLSVIGMDAMNRTAWRTGKGADVCVLAVDVAMPLIIMVIAAISPCER